MTLQSSFTDTLSTEDQNTWHKSNWSNGGYFVNTWGDLNVSFPGSEMVLTLEPESSGTTPELAISGEYSTNLKCSYGFYRARLKASSVPGTITGFFTYTGGDTNHDEIDIEIKGDTPDKLQLNYWTNGVEHPIVFDLHFDASLEFHDYGFNWTPSGIDWFVDNRLIHSENGTNGPIPNTPGQLFFNYWGVQNTSGWSSDYDPLTPASSVSVKNVSFLEYN